MAVRTVPSCSGRPVDLRRVPSGHFRRPVDRSMGDMPFLSQRAWTEANKQTGGEGGKEKEKQKRREDGHRFVELFQHSFLFITISVSVYIYLYAPTKISLFFRRQSFLAVVLITFFCCCCLSLLFRMRGGCSSVEQSLHGHQLNGIVK